MSGRELEPAQLNEYPELLNISCPCAEMEDAALNGAHYAWAWGPESDWHAYWYYRGSARDGAREAQQEEYEEEHDDGEELEYQPVLIGLFTSVGLVDVAWETL